jgi:hypothetical protein
MLRVIAIINDWVPVIFEWLTLLGVFVFAPLACFRRCRIVAAAAFMIAAPLCSILLWFSSAVTVYGYFGLSAVILSTLGIGIGTVVLAIVAIVMRGTGVELLGIGIMIAVTAGFAIAAVTLDPEHASLTNDPSLRA